jgi:hypothetical protein
VELVQKRYGTRFSVVMSDLSQKDDLRVMDIDGHHAFKSFSFEELGPPIYSPVLQKSVPEVGMEERIESERLFAKIDEYGDLVETSYLPMLGSRIVPSVPLAAGVLSMRARFKIDGQGMIFDGSPQTLNGRQLVLHGRVSPALGRTGTETPSCTWRLDNEGGCT